MNYSLWITGVDIGRYHCIGWGRRFVVSRPRIVAGELRIIHRTSVLRSPTYPKHQPPKRVRPPLTIMNTISPPPQYKRISGPKRALGIVAGVAFGLGANAVLAYSVVSFYTRSTRFVPYDTTAPEHSSPTFQSHNPAANPPVCIDHAVKEVPYGKLPQRYWVKGSNGRIGVDKAQLTTDFCRGVWSGVAFRVQRRYLERKYRALPGREDQLWDVKELASSEYAVGTKITDHFEVVEHAQDKVCT